MALSGVWCQASKCYHVWKLSWFCLFKSSFYNMSIMLFSLSNHFWPGLLKQLSCWIQKYLIFNFIKFFTNSFFIGFYFILAVEFPPENDLIINCLLRVNFVKQIRNLKVLIIHLCHSLSQTMEFQTRWSRNEVNSETCFLFSLLFSQHIYLLLDFSFIK